MALTFMTSLDLLTSVNKEFHKERTWACLDIVDETYAPSP